MRIDLVLQDLKFQLMARLLRALNVVQKIPNAVNHADDLILKRFNLVARVNHGLHLQILSADLCYRSAQLLNFCGFTEQKDCQECDCYHAEQQADCHRCQADAAKFTRYIAFGHNTERQPAGQLGALIDHKTGNTVDFRIAAAACFALSAACQQLCSDLLRHVQRVDNAFAYRVNDINCAKTVEVLAIAVVQNGIAHICLYNAQLLTAGIDVARDGKHHFRAVAVRQDHGALFSVHRHLIKPWLLNQRLIGERRSDSEIVPVHTGDHHSLQICLELIQTQHGVQNCLVARQLFGWSCRLVISKWVHNMVCINGCADYQMVNIPQHRFKRAVQPLQHAADIALCRALRLL